MGILDGKVALITGAGGGLGRAHALLFADEGARVVVNDLGEIDSDGETVKTADRVVAEIEEAGGEAVANYGSVSDEDDAEQMVEQAVEAFGQLDIVVNNAGILRDKTLVKMTREMWDPVIDVHLTGTFLVTRAAVRKMMQLETAGRIINTTSLAGLLGNFGQTNYSAAKAGIAGITRTVAMETRKFGITVNAIAPVAKTRMTEDIDAVPTEMEPEDVSPLVTWLASAEAEDVTGRIFGAHGSHYFEYKTERTPGVDLGEERWTPSKVGEKLEEIEQMPRAAAAGGQDDVADQIESLFAALPGTLKADIAGSWSATIQFEVKGTGTYTIAVEDGKAQFQTGEADDPDGTVEFDSAATLLAMAAGELQPEQAFMSGKIASDNMDVLMKFGKFFNLADAAAELGEGGSEDGGAKPEGLNREMLGEKYKESARFVKEPEMVAYAEATEDQNPDYVDVDREGGIIAPPLFTQKLLHEVLGAAITDERINADLLRLVHGEQDMHFHRPLEPWDLVAARAEIVAMEEKSTGELLQLKQWLVCEGEVVTESVSGLFIRGDSGGAKKKKTGGSADRETPERDIIHEESQFVASDQSLRYADASGDHNPIHKDPDVAKSAGLPNIILHGMCTMAFAGKAVVDGVLGGDSRGLKRLKVRFAKPVLPEQTVTTRIWEEGTNELGRRVLGFEATNDDGVVVLKSGIAEVEG
ncbi:MAG: SDR family NAD(P)-dependent oxidoreductase [Myxococcota bacterium]